MTKIEEVVFKGDVFVFQQDLQHESSTAKVNCKILNFTPKKTKNHIVQKTLCTSHDYQNNQDLVKSSIIIFTMTNSL